MRTDRGWRRFYAIGWLVSGVAGAAAVAQWTAYVREVERRAEEAERTRDEAARRRAVEERLRIARELHDSLTHSISVIKVRPVSPRTSPARTARSRRPRCSRSRRPAATPCASCARPSTCCAATTPPTAAASSSCPC